MAKINAFTRRELKEDEVYIFKISLCNNDIDRDFEKFSLASLQAMAPLFIGKTGIFDHSMRSADQKARIFDTCVEKVPGKKTADGEEFYCLNARAYMLRNEENKALIDEIEAGIKKEVSVSCSVENGICSVCGKDKRHERCEHVTGKYYGGKLCYSILENPCDAYEFSFVAVPAQREAGVIKSFSIGDEKEMSDVLSLVKSCDREVKLSAVQAKELSDYIEGLEEGAKLGEAYKNSLAAEVTKLFALAFPEMDKKLFSSVVSVMTVKELLGFKEGLRTKRAALPQPQLAAADRKDTKEDYSQFKI